jgi:hypothetical protein
MLSTTFKAIMKLLSLTKSSGDAIAGGKIKNMRISLRRIKDPQQPTLNSTNSEYANKLVLSNC